MTFVDHISKIKLGHFIALIAIMIYVVNVLDLINILKLSIILNSIVIYMVDKIKK